MVKPCTVHRQKRCQEDEGGGSHVQAHACVGQKDTAGGISVAAQIHSLGRFPPRFQPPGPARPAILLCNGASWLSHAVPAQHPPMQMLTRRQRAVVHCTVSAT